ncbi:MAG: glycosyltransferase [Phormidesmis sp.]
MKKVAAFIPSLAGGGAERGLVNLLKSMTATDISWDLILASKEGPYLDEVPSQVRLIDLKVKRVSQAIVPLARYLRREQPSILIAYMSHTSLAAIAARKLALSKTRLILVEQQSMTSRPLLFRARFVPPLMRQFYPSAEAVVVVSQGMVAEMIDELRLSKDKIHAIANPVVGSDLLAQASEKADHPWLQDTESIPVFLNVGRLHPQKNQALLLNAFAAVRAKTQARLIILGEGEERSPLENLAKQLGIADDVSMPGFVDNPYSYMSKATAFVLSSNWEGLPTVLIEALACGCPVISTDCPTGPSEILCEGEYGRLVPMEDMAKLSQAMSAAIQDAVDREILVSRAMHFSAQKVSADFIELFNKVGALSQR